MTHDDIERRLRTERDRFVGGYHPVPLPDSPEGLAGASRLGRLTVLLATIAAGAATAIIVIALLGAPGPTPVGEEPLATPQQSSSAAPSAQASVAPSDDAVEACRAADMAVASDPWDAGAGSRGTRVTFRILDSVAGCLLGGSLEARITDAGGELLVDGGSAVAQAMMVVGGDQLDIGVAWSNWCGPAPTQPLTLAFTIPDGELLIALAPPDGPILVPPCLGSGQPSSLSVTGFEPSTGVRPEP